MKKSLSVLAAWLLLWPLAFAQDAATYDDGIAKFKAGHYAEVQLPALSVFAALAVAPILSILGEGR